MGASALELPSYIESIDRIKELEKELSIAQNKIYRMNMESFQEGFKTGSTKSIKTAFETIQEKIYQGLALKKDQATINMDLLVQCKHIEKCSDKEILDLLGL